MQVEELRGAYRLTWLEWMRQTDALQRILDCAGKGSDREGAGPDSAQLEKMLLAVEAARAAHNEARDRLAQLLGNSPAPVPAEPGDGRVRTAAHLLWEFAGRPDGTAESDWQRARTMVRTAGAGAGER
jgi:hypothetical protein